MLIRTEHPVDLTWFEQLWTIVNELLQRLEARFDPYLESSDQNLQNFSSTDGQMKEYFKAFSGREVN
jgi:hypothetical protein